MLFHPDEAVERAVMADTDQKFNDSVDKLKELIQRQFPDNEGEVVDDFIQFKESEFLNNIENLTDDDRQRWIKEFCEEKGIALR